MSDPERSAAERAIDLIEPLDDQQVETLKSTLRLRPDGSATEDEVQRLLDWARQVYTDRVVLDLLVLDKVVVVGFEGARPRFATIDEAGGAAVEALRLLDSES